MVPKTKRQHMSSRQSNLSIRMMIVSDEENIFVGGAGGDVYTQVSFMKFLSGGLLFCYVFIVNEME